MKALLLLGVLVATCAVAQDAAVPSPSFEVATIRPAQPGSGAEGHWSPPGIGRFDVHSMPLAFLIRMAYGVDDDQIAGKPAWLETDLYDVAAKPEAGVALSREELKPLLQDLLRQRFHLAAHTSSAEVKGFVLLVAKGGPKLVPTKGEKWPGFRVDVSPGKLRGINWSMPILATMLKEPVGLPVADRTGVAGSYDIDLTFAPDMDQELTLPSIFTALQERLGLRLEPQKVSVAIVVIDHLDKVPTGN